MLGLLFSCLSAAETAQTGESAALLARIREAALDNLRRLPNFTCGETIERSSRTGGKGPFESVDRVRLEVGYIDGRELFGWPGGEKLAEQDLRRLVHGNTTNGEYALLIRALFSRSGVVWGEMAPEDRNGRAAVRFDFRVPRKVSDFVVAAGVSYALLGYHGSLWADRDSLQVAEIRIAADDIPWTTAYTAISRALELRPAAIGTGQFVLPARAVFSATTANGVEYRNETEFHDCRQYLAESVIRFEEEPVADGGGKAPAATREAATALPETFQVTLELESPVDSETSAVGDPIAARLLAAIKSNGQTVVPKGAILHGRIVRLDVVDGRRNADFAFTYFEAGGMRVRIGSRRNQIVARRSRIFTPDQGPILAGGRDLRLPRGFSFELLSTAAGGR
jgi:hypothetical protein